MAYEAEQSSRHHPPLRGISEDGWLRDPIEITDSRELAEVERVRRAVFGGVASQPLKHLGEAETCVLITMRPELRDAVWITDD